MKKEICLYLKKKNCSACGACLNACHQNAISMNADEKGFLYPVIDKVKCIQCGKCQSVCNYQNKKSGNSPKNAYIGMTNNEKLLQKSASGGIFATIATEILNKGGAVYGCSLELREDTLYPMHIRIDKLEELSKLQGSKYVQSNVGNIYKNVQGDLNGGRIVLFTGTPCQIDALKGFLNGKEYSNLLTMDIICHGVPSEKMFVDYLHILEKKLKGKIVSFVFRDKAAGWGFKGTVKYINGKEQLKKKSVPVILSSYYKLFLLAETYRENCYTCKYADMNRVGDITIGDFWGVEVEHPEAILENGGSMDVRQGISCILVNTEQGQVWLDKFGIDLLKVNSSIEKVARHNGQLNRPSKHSDQRSQILSLYEKYGYEAVDKWYYKSLGWKRYLYVIRHALPWALKLRDLFLK